MTADDVRAGSLGDGGAADGLDVAVDALVLAIFGLEHHLSTCCCLARRCGTQVEERAALSGLDGALALAEHLCSAARASLARGGRLADHV